MDGNAASSVEFEGMNCKAVQHVYHSSLLFLIGLTACGNGDRFVWWSRKIKGRRSRCTVISHHHANEVIHLDKVPISVRWAESIGCNGVDCGLTLDCGRKGT
jgi:hypothetical protein